MLSMLEKTPQRGGRSFSLQTRQTRRAESALVPGAGDISPHWTRGCSVASFMSDSWRPRGLQRAGLPFTVSQTLLKLMSTKLVMPSK